MSNSPRTSIIIPCYFLDPSFIEMTQKCLDSLNYDRPDEIIVVDDGSPLLGRKTIRGHDIYLERPYNKGYAAAVNTGLNNAEGEFLIISNNDIVFTPGWLEAILLPLKQGYDISSIRTSDNGWTTEDKVTEGDKFGSLWAMKRKVFETIGGLSEEFGKGYFEDLDFHRRAVHSGFRVGKNHNHLVEHHAKATFKVVDPNDDSYVQGMEIYRQRYGSVD